MRNAPLPERPDGAVESLDRGLRLLQLLRDYGSLRVMDAAAHLGTSRSSAHRLLQTLVYRGYSIQDENHTYLPGPSLEAAPARLAWTKDFRALCHPHLHVLSRRSGESANMMVRVGTSVRFLGTVRAQSVYATNDRDGIVMAAHRASGGKALLAELSTEALRTLYPDVQHHGVSFLDNADFATLAKDLETTKQRGFAINYEETEVGVAAIGAAVHDRTGEAIGAISLSTQTDRFVAAAHQALIPLLLDARTQIEQDLRVVDLGRCSNP